MFLKMQTLTLWWLHGDNLGNHGGSCLRPVLNHELGNQVTPPPVYRYKELLRNLSSSLNPFRKSRKCDPWIWGEVWGSDGVWFFTKSCR